MDRFNTELKEYIVPEVIDAFLQADQGDMKHWMSEAAYNVSWAVLGEYIKSGLVSSSQVIEVSSVDVLQAKFHNETVPVFLATCESQEVFAWKSAKTGEVKVGDVGSVKRSRYVFALTMVESELENEVTGGWKVVEVSSFPSSPFLSPSFPLPFPFPLRLSIFLLSKADISLSEGKCNPHSKLYPSYSSSLPHASPFGVGSVCWEHWMAALP